MFYFNSSKSAIFFNNCQVDCRLFKFKAAYIFLYCEEKLQILHFLHKVMVNLIFLSLGCVSRKIAVIDQSRITITLF